MSILQVVDTVPQVYGKPLPIDELRLYAYRLDNPSVLIPLTAHQITDINYTDQERTPYIAYVQIGGSIQRREVFLSGLNYTAMSGVLGIPDGLWSPVDDIVKNAECWRFIVRRECPPTECENVWFDVTDGVVSKPRFTSAFIGFDASGAPLTRTSQIDMTDLVPYYSRAEVKVVDYADPIYALAFNILGCPGGCDCNPFDSGFFGGGDGTAVGTAFSTANGFASGTALTTGVPVGDVVTDIYSDGSITLIAHADTNDYATSVSGGIRYSKNGTTFAAATGISTPIHSIVKAGAKFYAVGDNDVYRSLDGVTWTALVTGLATTVNFAQAAYDSSKNITWLVGVNSGAGVIYKMIDDGISAVTFPAGAIEFVSVAVLAEDHILVGGNGGYVYESTKASGASSASGWKIATFGTADVTVVGGKKLDAFFGIGTALYRRDPMTDMEWKLTPVSPAVAGDYTDIAIARDVNGVIQTIRLSTTAGEVVFLDNCLPTLCGLV